MPGQLLHRVAQRVCPRETDRVFEPLIADLQREWIDTRPGSRRAFALIRAYASFWSSVAVCAATMLRRGAVSPVDRRMTTAASLACVCGLVGLSMLRAVGAPGYYWHLEVSAIALNEAQAWSWAIVFAMIPAFMYARGEPDRRWDATATRMLITALLITVACVGWLGPALFQAAEHTHPHGQILADSEQPAFQSLPTVVRMVRNHTTDAKWVHALDRRLAEIANVLLLAIIGWQLSGIRRPSIGRVAFWWFALMEFVLVSGRYAINHAEWQQWRASGVLVLILLALHAAAKRNGPDLSAPPALPDLMSQLLNRFASIPYWRTL